MTEQERMIFQDRAHEVIDEIERIAHLGDEQTERLAGYVVAAAYCICRKAGLDFLATARLVKEQMDHETAARSARTGLA